MSADRRAPRYPLEALHKREGWRLDALQSELGTASRRLIDCNERYTALCREYRVTATAAAPLATAFIDPVVARSRLLYLSDMHTRMKAAAQAVGELEGSRDRLRTDSGKQHGKLEAIEQHRREFLREEAARADRLQSAEADRDWLARSQWRKQHADVGAQPSDETDRAGGSE